MSGIDRSAVDKGLGPPPGDTPGDADVTQWMEDMLSPITSIDCCGPTRKEEGASGSGWAGL